MVLTTGPEIGAQLEVMVERIAHGAEGVAHVGGLVVFVPWTAPGDRVRAEVVERRPRWARARLLEVVAPSPTRVTPGCPVFERCGGCQVQHLAPEDQRRAKARIVEDAFTRIARLEPPEPVVCLPAAEPWHYRQRAALSWRWDGGRLALGFHAAALPRGGTPPHSLVDVVACPIFAEAGNAALARLREALAAALDGGGVTEGRLLIRALAPDRVDAGIFAEDVELAGRLARACARGAGIPVTFGHWSPGGRPALARGAPRLHAFLERRGLRLRAGFDSFLQVDLVAAEQLYDAAMEDLDAAPAERVIDAYAGIGVVTCRLAARGVRVTAIEAHPGAAADLRANTAAITDAEVHVLELPAERVDWNRPRPDEVLVNPPRTGCPARALDGITRSTARRLVYVACEPTTLARDVQRLGGGWRLARIRAFDLFPQTAHVETVVRMDRR